MGWDFTAGATKQDIIARLTKTTTTTKTVAQAVRGNVLWTVRETIHPDGTIARWIGCDLLGAERGFGWGYKDMNEEMGPYYFTCPLKFLDMAPVANAAWRETVRAKAAVRAKKLALGQTVALVGATIPALTITSLRPLLGTYGGQTYRLPRRLIALDNP